MTNSESREVLVRDEERQTFDSGFEPETRPPDLYLEFGVINLDKPPGPTSHQATAWAREIVGAEKAGHGGTLDPSVTGVLPIALNRATNALTPLIRYSKAYVGVMKLHDEVDERKVRETAYKFQGRVYQRPPKKSAVRRKLRTRQVYSLDVLEKQGRNVLFRVSCEAGFYVRKLVHDMGLVLGSGAHMSELRRVRSGPFLEDGVVDLYQLEFAFHKWREEDEFDYVRDVVRPFEETFGDEPEVYIRNSAVSPVCHGAQLAVPGVLKITDDVEKGESLVIYTQKGEAVALGRAEMTKREMMEEEEGIAVSLERVLMSRDLYPKTW